ncbi:MAG: MFS transporter [Promethearchaeota archaeon]
MKKNETTKISKKNMVSFGFGTFLNEFIAMAFSAFAFFFYESEIGLNVWLVSAAFFIYAIWNAINDPLVGYLTNRIFKFTEKWGRRFPWIIFGAVPYALFYVLIFMPPSTDPQGGALIIFIWLVFSMCLYDTFASIFWVNYSSLFPDKFRTPDERRKANGVNILIGVLGTVSGAIIPPLFISFGVLPSYMVQGSIVFLIGFIAACLMIPGCREKTKDTQRYLAILEKEEKEQTSFFKTLKTSLKNKNFVAYIFIIFSYQTMVRSMTASIPYVAQFILKLEASTITLVMGAMLGGVLIFTPAWVMIASKINNNRKVLLITGGALTLATIPLIFVNTILGFIVCMFIWGSFMGGFWVLQLPTFSDVIDETIILTHKREEGIYSGFNQFFSRLAFFAQALNFAIVHTLTGFVEGADTQSAQAIQGIQIHFAVVPLVALLIGVIVFWKIYDITPKIVQENQLKIKELGL